MLGHGPKDEVLVRNVSFVWQVWPENGNLISAASLSLNGKKQKAIYDKERRTLEFTPPEPLSSGEYKVSAQVIVNGWAKFNKDWVLRVSSEAFDKIPEPSAEAKQAIEALNSVRSSAGLPATKTDERLCYASFAHARYLSQNSSTSHLQSPSGKGFFGAEPADRLARMGFGKGSWEILAPVLTDPETGIKRLFDAPYHRISMLNPGAIEVGAGWDGGNLVVDGASSSDEETVLSPGDGQKDVQPFWKDTEWPNPYRLHGISEQLVGYPIMFVRFGTNQISVSRFEVRDERGRQVDCFQNLPGRDDHLTNAAFVMPKSPLESGRTYRVSVAAKDASGKDISRAWSFTTASDGGVLAGILASRQGALGMSQAPMASRLRRR